MRQEKRITIEDRGNKLEFVVREMRIGLCVPSLF